MAKKNPNRRPEEVTQEEDDDESNFSSPPPRPDSKCSNITSDDDVDSLSAVTKFKSGQKPGVPIHAPDEGKPSKFRISGARKIDLPKLRKGMESGKMNDLTSDDGTEVDSLSAVKKFKSGQKPGVPIHVPDEGKPSKFRISGARKIDLPKLQKRMESGKMNVAELTSDDGTDVDSLSAVKKFKSGQKPGVPIHAPDEGKPSKFRISGARKIDLPKLRKGMESGKMNVLKGSGFAERNEVGVTKHAPDEGKPSKLRIPGLKRLCKIGRQVSRNVVNPPVGNITSEDGTDVDSLSADRKFKSGQKPGVPIHAPDEGKPSKFRISGARKKDLPKLRKGMESGKMNVLKGSGFAERNKVGVTKHVPDEGKPSKVRIPSKEGIDPIDQHCIVLKGSGSAQFELPGEFAKFLFPYQREGLYWLWKLYCEGKSGILGDDMGLGKTKQVCSFLAGLFRTSLIKRVLVVAPPILLSTWQKELSDVDLSNITRKYHGAPGQAREYQLQCVLKDGGVLLTSYDIARNSVESLQGDRKDPWDYMVLDEAHLLKNPETLCAKALLKIPAAHKILVTGTPVQNNLEELRALFKFCLPDLLGDQKGFKDNYENAIRRGNLKSASLTDRRIGNRVAEDLRKLIEPYFLRRLKSVELKDVLPQKQEIVVWLKLSDFQRHLYDSFVKSDWGIDAFHHSALPTLTILKKLCDHPILCMEGSIKRKDTIASKVQSYVTKEVELLLLSKKRRIAVQAEAAELNKNLLSCKITFILSLLDKLIPEGHSVLIFAQTQQMLDILEESLDSRGYNSLRIDGSIKAKDRVAIIENFQKGGAPIFLLTSQVGGLGLTLTHADRVIVVDPSWNPSIDNQSVDRVYRLGQMNEVMVYRLITSGTIEEKIYRKQVYKWALFKSATEQTDVTRYFTEKDLRDMFSIPENGFDVSWTQRYLFKSQYPENMSESLKSNIKFVESLGIAGISYHSLLFTEEEDVQKERPKTGVSSSNISMKSSERTWAKYPKVGSRPEVGSSKHSYTRTETSIIEEIQRLQQYLADKDKISRLRDGGEHIRRRINELESDLRELRNKKKK